MPSEQLGERYSCIATKVGQHGDPAVENFHPGIAAKSRQAAPAYPTQANADAARQIAVGEEQVIMLHGAHEVRVALLPAGAAVGNPLWISTVDNSLALAAGANLVKFGRISAIDTTLGRALVNLNLRDSF